MSDTLTEDRTPVPHPTETRVVTVAIAGQKLSDEQRGRLCSWLRANGLEPRLVAAEDVTVHYRVQGDQQGPGRIFFTQYYVDDAGHKVVDPSTNRAATFRRCVAEKAKLEPEPAGDVDV